MELFLLRLGTSIFIFNLHHDLYVTTYILQPRFMLLPGFLLSSVLQYWPSTVLGSVRWKPHNYRTLPSMVSGLWAVAKPDTCGQASRAGRAWHSWVMSTVLLGRRKAVILGLPHRGERARAKTDVTQRDNRQPSTQYAPPPPTLLAD